MSVQHPRDEFYMRLALESAEEGAGRTAPNPMVGAVVVREHRVVGRGFHARLGGAHAEVQAIDAAGINARGATLYVTLEPCNHFGRTPPCTAKILEAGIARVVVAMEDPNPRVAGGGNAHLQSRGLAVTCGVCRGEAEELNQGFIKHVRSGRPYVVLKWAATLDGFIATGSGDSRWVSGPAARQRVHRLRHRSDAVLVGIGTVRADNPRLTTRLEDRTGADPLRVILDSHLSLPTDARMLTQDSPAATLVVGDRGADPRRRARLEAAGAQVVVGPRGPAGVDLPWLMGHLGELGVTSLLIEGGSRVAAASLAAGIVDRLMLFYAPKILGGGGVPICRGPGVERMADCWRLRDVRQSRLGDDLLVEGSPVRPPAAGIDKV
jgi:diaminohydroxyphosphoribosylaminopyrimidine deaminase/5-amino-6-(5-phosphoribosylamino)uracil reductase